MNAYCIYNVNDPDCTVHQNRSKIISIASNITHSVICFLLSTSIIIGLRFKIGDSPGSNKKKIERRLLLQAFITSIFFNMYNASLLMIEKFRDSSTKTAAGAWGFMLSVAAANFTFFLFHYCQIILLIILNPTVREAVFRFYRIPVRAGEHSKVFTTRVQNSNSRNVSQVQTF
uniref:7TM GPCR serpentine receptor class x (Srx) domain-containing protein n=1 Tax=Panagrolaimus sp. JU765 TaxID=591449 RepID=A0AC34QE65_9BILA